MEHARLLMAIDSQPAAMLEEKPSEVQLLTEQVATLSTRQQRDKQSESGRQPRCFSCSQFGYVIIIINFNLKLHRIVYSNIRINNE